MAYISIAGESSIFRDEFEEDVVAVWEDNAESSEFFESEVAGVPDECTVEGDLCQSVCFFFILNFCLLDLNFFNNRRSVDSSSFCLFFHKRE